MLEHLKALPVVLLAGWLVYWLSRMALAELIPPALHARLFRLFVIATVGAFALPSFWLYVFLLFLVVLIHDVPATEVQASWRGTVWMGLVLAVPCWGILIPPFAGIGNFLTVSHINTLTLAICFLIAFKSNPPAQGGLPTQARPPDWHVVELCLLMYLGSQLLIIVVAFQSNFTSILRTLFTMVIDVWLPFRLISRSFTNPTGLKMGVYALLQTGLLLGALGVVESLRHWRLFDGVAVSWNHFGNLEGYLMRDGLLRASTTAGHSLPFGFAMAVMLGLWVGLRQCLPGRGWFLLGCVALTAGLLSSLSRGSWLGTAVIFTVFALLGRRPVLNLIVLGVGAAVAASVLAALVPSFADLLERMMNPSLMSAPDQEKEYRQQLLETAVELIKQSPWAGVPDAYSRMEHLRQGQGIIDIVNTYVGLALAYGVPVTSMFISFFLAAFWRMWRVRQSLPLGHEGRAFAQSLMAVLAGVMLMIFSTSPIGSIYPVIYCLLGLVVCVDRIYGPVAPASVGWGTPMSRGLHDVRR